MIKYSLLVFVIVASLMIQPMAFGATSSSPKGQYAAGTDLHEIECKGGYELIFKAKSWSPACVKASSVERLISLGWAANHDAQHQKMMESEKMADPKDKANSIAQAVVKREQQRRICKNSQCKHSLDDHIRNSDTCLVLNCSCLKFVK